MPVEIKCLFVQLVDGVGRLRNFQLVFALNEKMTAGKLQRNMGIFRFINRRHLDADVTEALRAWIGIIAVCALCVSDKTAGGFLRLLRERLELNVDFREDDSPLYISSVLLLLRTW